MKNLVQYQPIGVAVSAPTCFKLYASGVLTESSCVCAKYYTGGPEVDHSMTVVGYATNNDVAGCDGWWIAKNSYGTAWGENGYIRICIPTTQPLKQYGTCHIQSFAMFSNVGLISGL